ncbi:radical SAM protein with 4Fe4S-binding SPASM domain [Bradyrhizobium diazoefficiens]
MPEAGGPVRALSVVDTLNNIPVSVVWEITLGCNLGCLHCGSRAGSKRETELDTREAKQLIEDLAQLGTRELCLIGGEVFVRRDWVELVRHAKKCGLYCVVQTGGYRFPLHALQEAHDAGLDGLGISIDGFESDHDFLRGRTGSFAEATKLMKWAVANIGPLSVNTQLTSRSLPRVPEFGAFLANEGVKFWQLQLTVPMGNASDNFELCLQPKDLTSLYEALATAYPSYLAAGMLLIPGNNVGYFGRYEHLWRGPARGGHYFGCVAGVNGMGIEADGTIKACPSLPKERYGSGNVRESSLAQLWHGSELFEWNRAASAREYSGYCAECYYRDVCRAGCTWMTDSLFGKPGNNPYCIYRVEQLASRGITERIAKVQDAPQVSFGTGLYEIIEEARNADNAASLM